MNMVFTMGFRVQIFGRRCALEPSFFFVKRQYTKQLTDKQGEQFLAVSNDQKHRGKTAASGIINKENGQFIYDSPCDPPIHTLPFQAFSCCTKKTK